MSVSDALERSLEAAADRLTDQDAAVIELARLVARRLESNPASTSSSSERLVSCLVELGLTPKSRKAILAGKAAEAQPAEEKDPFDALSDELAVKRADRTA